jgi:hypothetical protein
MEGFSKINYKGKEIFYVDYSSFVTDTKTQKEKIMQLRKNVTSEYTKQPLNSVSTLLNVSGFQFDMNVLTVFKQEVSKADPYEKKSAIIGVKGLVKTAYNFVVGFTSPKVKVFDTELEAKEWLIKD